MRVQDVLPRDAIQSIDAPAFGTDYFGDPDDDVLVVPGSPPRAYPIRILSHHEIVNDVHTDEDGEERPIAVTWCPICASGVVFDRRVEDRTLTFGTSGKLADDALVLYDRETESEWKQPLGAAIDGPLAGTRLEVLPASVMEWVAFRNAYPEGEVLEPEFGGRDDPRGRNPRSAYDMTSYERYAADDEFGLRAMRGEGPERSWDRGDIDAKTPVVGVVDGEEAVGYPAPAVEAAGGVVADTVGGRDVVVVSVADTLAAFEDPGFSLGRRDGRLHGDGATWDPETGRSDDGRALRPAPSRRLYAFAWQDDHGPDSFYGLD